MLGLLFLAATGILSYYTLFKTDFSLFDEKQELVVYAEDARGLRKGAPVLFAGVRWGKVDSVVPDLSRPRERRVEIRATLDQPIRLFGDHSVSIESSSVLGGVQLGIDPGGPEMGELESTTELVAASQPDVLAAVGAVIQENREPLRNAIAGIEAVVETLQGNQGTFGRLLNDEETANNLSNAVESIQRTFDNAAALTEELRGGQGTIGKLIYDTDLYDRLETAVGSLDQFFAEGRQLLTDAREGKGVVGTLVYDEAVAQNLKDTVESLRSAAEKIDRGEGTVAKLLNDDALVTKAESLLDSLQNPDGTVARLFNDPALYNDVQRIVADIADATAALREQRGPLGMLFYDTAARDQLIRGIQVLTGSLEEQREAAPIATFLGTVFLGF